MSDRSFTLIDVMRGIRKHGLTDKMSEECFTFLIGLILEANELGFKNPIGLTVNQALPIGGGNNRQTLHGRRTSLGKFKIEGKTLVKIKAGNKGQNSVATYKIDYDLICSYNGVWQGETDTPSDEPSNILDNSSDSSPNGGLTIPKIRGEERREDPPHTTSNNITTPEKPEKPQPKEDDKDRFKWLLEQFQKADMGFSIVNDIQRQKVIALLDYPDGEIEAVMYRAAEKGVKGSNLISWAEKGLAEYDRLYNGKENDLSYDKRDQLEREVKELSQELEITIQLDDPRNAAWIEQTQGQIQKRREALGRIKG